MRDAHGRFNHEKRDHKALTNEELTWMIEQYTAKAIPDYQMSAFLMAVYFNGMTPEERSHFALQCCIPVTYLI